MITAEADIRTEHAARYLARLCGHAGKMGTAGHRMGHRRPSRAHGDTPPDVRRVECSGTEGTVSLDWGQWTMRVLPGRLGSAPKQPTRRACGGSRISSPRA
jgi:hypothetical protein